MCSLLSMIPKIRLRIRGKKLDEIREPFGEVIVNLSSIELLEYNKKELGRMMENEKHQKELSINQSRKKTEQSL